MEPRYAADERTEEERLADESAWIDWIKGTPEAIEAGRAALGALGAFHDGSDSIRQAVATQQKRWGAVPTGALTPDQWDRLHAEHAATS